jgi:hypothetical protein
MNLSVSVNKKNTTQLLSSASYVGAAMQRFFAGECFTNIKVLTQL